MLRRSLIRRHQSSHEAQPDEAVQHSAQARSSLPPANSRVQQNIQPRPLNPMDETEAPIPVSVDAASPSCAVSAVALFADSRAQVTRTICSLSLAANKVSAIAVRGLPPPASVDAASFRAEGRIVHAEKDTETKPNSSASILDVAWAEKWTSGDASSVERIAAAENELEAAQDARDGIKAGLESVEKQLAFVDKYGDAILAKDGIATGDQSMPRLLSKDALDSIADFLAVHSKHANELRKTRLEKMKELRKQTDKVAVLQANLDALRGPTGPNAKKVSGATILVRTTSTSQEPVVVNIDLIYVVYNCSWTPYYDLRVSSDDQSLELIYKAKITNRTGEDWTRVKLSLSTSRPTTASNPPAKPTSPWALSIRPKFESFAAPQAKSRGMFAPRAISSPILATSIAMMAESAPAGGAMSSQTFDLDAATIGSKSGLTGTSVFSIPGTPTIQADGAEHAVTITRLTGAAGKDIPGSLVPKFSYRGYLRTQSYGPTPGPASDTIWSELKVTNSTDWDLLDGPIGISVDDAFIARVDLSATPPSDSFSVSLGPDPSLRIIRKPPLKSRDASSTLTSLFGGKQSVQRISERSILRNARGTKILATVVDQIPTSQDERIKIGIVEPSGLSELIRRGEREGSCKVSASVFPLGKSEEYLTSGRRPNGGMVETTVSFSKETGVVEWEVAVPAGSEVLLQTAYEVAWPSGEVVDGI